MFVMVTVGLACMFVMVTVGLTSVCYGYSRSDIRLLWLQ